jgi:hypothetical protein
VTIRQLKQRDLAHAAFYVWKPRTTAAKRQGRQYQSSKLRIVPESVPQLPPRPDSSVLNDSIPVFFVGRNAAGFWVARQAEERCGGLFFLKRSAKRFARNQTSPWGYATVFLDTPLELDAPNQGNRLVRPVAAAVAIAERRVPALVTFLRMAASEWGKLVQQIRACLPARVETATRSSGPQQPHEFRHEI